MNNTITLQSIQILVENNNNFLLNIRELIIDNKISNYPIFILSKNINSSIGKLLLNDNENKNSWNIFITHLEELYNKKFINDEALDNFKIQYKDKCDHFCILYFEDSENTGFVFSPINFLIDKSN